MIAVPYSRQRLPVIATTAMMQTTLEQAVHVMKATALTHSRTSMSRRVTTTYPVAWTCFSSMTLMILTAVTLKMHAPLILRIMMALQGPG